MPCIIGVPTAPKVTGMLLNIKVIMTAAIGRKPRYTSRGAVRAAGVPKPAAPSIKALNVKPIRSACRRASEVSLVNWF